MIYVQLITTLRSITTTATTAPAIVDEDIVNANRQRHTYFTPRGVFYCLVSPPCHICYNTYIMSAKKKPAPKSAAPIVNRRARFDYELGEELVAGLVLTGLEARAARDGHIQLKGSYVTIKGGELWLNNASFSLKLNERGKPGSRTVDTEPRKLLVSKKQLDSLAASKKTGMTIVPTKLLTKGRYIKIVIALGKGKKHWDKRQTIKARDIDREHKKMMK